MNILLVADGRSPITRGWVDILQHEGWKISLVSTFPCQPVSGTTDLFIIPTAFSSMAGSQAGAKGIEEKRRPSGLVSKFRPLFMTGRYWFGPLSLGAARKKFLEIIERVQPDVVHALRIPFEGMLARVTPEHIPLIVSIWGNDLTLHAKGSPFMAKETKLVLHRANGMLADANRDLRLGKEWGLKNNVPVLCVPGGGGIDSAAMQAVLKENKPLPVEIPPDVPVVINPRGFRPGSVRNDTFFQSIPLVLKEIPDTVFICVGMAGQSEALGWVKKLGIEKSVRLLPFLSQEELWRLFKRAKVSTSISQHDGTPNSLLEAMALGCFPIAGDIESVREWIVDGVNGLLIDPGNPVEAAEMVVRAIKNRGLSEKAVQNNVRMVNEKASKSSISIKVKIFFDLILSSH